jgi:hypothetical protein
VGRIKPSLEEMHPSKVHKSTTAEPDSGLLLGFSDINPKPGSLPSGLTQGTPTKTGITPSSSEFRFARPGPELGPDAQRMMDELREEALRIKEKLAAEQVAEKLKNGDGIASGIEGRKFAQPKGKVGRFSDIHMAEFKKMDSIAGHASSFRAQPGRLTPAKNSLKRTQSKAKLDDREESSVEQTLEMSTNTERLENTAPAKRARKHISDDTSSARPVYRDGDHTIKKVPSTPGLSHSQSVMPSSITTPTQASLARAAIAKQPGVHVPTLSRSPSKPNLTGTPRSMTKSASKNFLRSAGKFDRVKSILRYPSSSRKPASVSSSIPTLSRSASKSDLKDTLRSVPTTPLGLGQPKSVRRVNFTPDTANAHSTMVITNSPSPMKSGIPRSASKINLANTSHSAGLSQAKEVLYPSLAGHPALAKQTFEVDYPSLATPRPLPEPPRQVRTEPHPVPSVPGTFHFRSDHTINFDTSPRGFGSSPGQASVRQVRPSVFPGIIPRAFPDSNKENMGPLPSVPHGMPNKKRRRVDSDDDEDGHGAERSPKKHKASVAEGPMLMAPRITTPQLSPKSRIPSPAKKKNVLTMSRLNMLARPKMRK